MSTMQLFLAPTTPDINAKMSTQTENHVNQAFTIDDKTIAALEQSLSSEIASEIKNIDETILRNSSNNGNITENVHEDESLNHLSGTVSKNIANGSLCTEDVDDLETQNLEINKSEIINELTESSTEKNIQHSESSNEQSETLAVLNDASQPSFEDKEAGIRETNDILKSDNSSSPNKFEDDENISVQNEETKNVPNSADLENSNNEIEHVTAITTDTMYPDDVEMQEETNKLSEEPLNTLLDNVTRELIIENVNESAALLTDDDVPMHEVNQNVSEKLEPESMKIDEDQLLPDISNKSSVLGEIEHVKPLEIDEDELLSENNTYVTPVSLEAPPSPIEIDEEMSGVESIETKISIETDNIKKEDVVLPNENENITKETEDQEVTKKESPSVQENITDCNTLLLEHSNQDKVQIVTITEAEAMNNDNDKSSPKITLDDCGESEVSHESLTKTTEENNDSSNDISEDNISMDVDDFETAVMEKEVFEEVTSDDSKKNSSNQVDTIKTEVETLENPQNKKNPTLSEEISMEKSEERLPDKTEIIISLKARAEKETESSNVSLEEQEHSAGAVEESIDTTENKTVISLKSGPEKESDNCNVKEQEHIDITGNTNSNDDSVGEVEESIDTTENETVVLLKARPENETENSNILLKVQEHIDTTGNTNFNEDSVGEVDESIDTTENKTVISLKARPEKESVKSDISVKEQEHIDKTGNVNFNEDSVGEVDERIDTTENKTVTSLNAKPENESVNSVVSLKEQDHIDKTGNTNSNDESVGEVEERIDTIENKTVTSLKATPENESENNDVSLTEQDHIDKTGNTNSNDESVGKVKESIDNIENKTVKSLKATPVKESENNDVSLKEQEHIDVTENTNSNDDSVAEVEKSIDTTENKSSNEETIDKKVEGITRDDQDNVEIIDEDDIKIVEEPAEKQIKEKSPEKDETKDLPVVCKLSNTLDILSDEEEETSDPTTETSQTPTPEEKQCINIDDDDDIMLIEEDSNSKDKTDVSINKGETESKTSDKIDVETGEQNVTDSISMNNDKDVPEEKSPNMDLDPETELKTTSESKIKTAESRKPLLPQNFLKTAKKNLANMSRHELEDFCILRIVESIVDRSNLSDIKSKMKTMAQSLDDFKKRAIMMSKQNRDLQVVLKSIQEEQKKKTNTPVQPLKITRSVGMQVLMNEKLDPRRKTPIPTVAQPPPAGPLGRPVRAVQNVKQMKQPGSPANIPVPRKVPINNSPANKTNIHMNNVGNKSASPSPNNIRNPSPVLKAEKRTLSRMLSNSSSVTVDLTDDEPPAKVSNKTSPSQPVRVVPPQNLMAPQRSFPPVNNARKVYIPISGPQAQQLRPGQTIIMKNVPQGPRPGLRAAMPARAPGPQSPVRPKLGLTRHPAPLPESMKQYTPPNWKAVPPAPDLKLSKVENGIVISWKIDGYPEGGYETIASYQLYAYQETTAPPCTALWKKIGDVKALPLPMACTLTQFMAGFKYYFAVRAVDIRSRLGPFSLPGSILLLNKV